MVDLAAGQQKQSQSEIIEVGHAGVRDRLAIGRFAAGGLFIAEEAVVRAGAMVQRTDGQCVPTVDDGGKVGVGIEAAVEDAPGHSVSEAGCAAGFRAGIIVGVAEIHIPETVRPLHRFDRGGHLLKRLQIFGVVQIVGGEHIHRARERGKRPAISARPVTFLLRAVGGGVIGHEVRIPPPEMVRNIIEAVRAAKDAFDIVEVGIQLGRIGIISFQRGEDIRIEHAKLGKGGQGHVQGIDIGHYRKSQVALHPEVHVVDDVDQPVGLGGVELIKFCVLLACALIIGRVVGIAKSQRPIGECAPLHGIVVNVGIVVDAV